MRRGAVLAGVLAAIAIVGAASTPATGTQAARATAPAACGQSSGARPVINHVMVIVMENHSYSDVIGHAPFITALAKRCGLATNYHAITHPSLPNYLAMTSGSIHHIHSDCQPQSCSVRGPNVFSQVSRHHLRWRAYAESMSTYCDRGSHGLYAARHVPAVYYTRLRSAAAGTCARWASCARAACTSRSTADTPRRSCSSPRTCATTCTSCPLASGDNWLARWMPMIVKSRTYRRGHMAILLVWDEGGGNHNQVPLVAISRYTRPHTLAHRLLTHFSLLRATEHLLGIRRYLGKANGARGLPKAFHL